MVLLTILITTYNRARLLEKLLEKLTAFQEAGLEFDVVITDDCSTDNTTAVCNSFKDRMSGLSYYRHPKNVGMDLNFISAYNRSKTEYCWLPGDYRYVSYENLKEIIRLLGQKMYDAFILNCHPGNKIGRKDYTDINELMSEQGWHITNQASLIIPSKFVNPIFYKRYIGTTFTHLGMITENLCAMDSFKVAYLNDVHILSTEDSSFKRVGWMNHPFLNFGRYWFQFVMSLPNQISIETKQKMLLDHNRYTRIFYYKNVIRMKIDYGDEVMRSYKANRQFVPHVSTTPLVCYDLIAMCPTPLLAFMIRLTQTIKGHGSKGK